ncbi:MAG: BACON domain-containing protein, partial [Gemmatimonadaceae bacterium]
FVAGESNKSIRLYNKGKGHLNWKASVSASWITVTPALGALIPTDSVTLSVVVSRAGLPMEATATIELTSNSVYGPVTIPVIVTASNGFASGLTVLDHRVVDAEASASAELIVTVSAFPHQLHILDALTGTIEHVSLSAPPTCVAIRPDGVFAAVGHDASMTLVDLRSRSVVRQSPVPVDVLDLVLPMNGWAYAFPRRDQWTAIHSVQLSSGTVTTQMNHPGIYAGTLGRLHPSGDFMYGSENNISPADHVKFDIRDGAAQLMYDSRYHGDYPMGSDAWISDDGSRLFNRAAHVFRLSPNPADDIVYAGRLGGATVLLQWVSDAPQFGRILALRDEASGPESMQLHVYDRSTLGFTASRSLPSFTNGASGVAAHGKFAFPLRDRAYILVRADAGGGLLRDWGIVAFDRGQIP